MWASAVSVTSPPSMGGVRQVSGGGEPFKRWSVGSLGWRTVCWFAVGGGFLSLKVRDTGLMLLFWCPVIGYRLAR